MSSRCPEPAVVPADAGLRAGACLALLLTALVVPAHAADLRVCADPNNLPFSNARLEGFENRIVALVAEELGARPRYTWWAQRRGFVRSTLKAGLCDLVPGVPARMEMLRTTRPYYRSSYVLVTRPGTAAPATLDDPQLRTLTLGVQLIGDDGYNTPPAHALARRGMVRNVRGYTVYGDYAEPNPPARIVEAVARSEIDAALAWGPLAGYFARRLALRVTPIAAGNGDPPMRFAIAMGVRHGDDALHARVEAALAKRRAEIDAVLADYGVPRAEGPP